jgi:hypothetical protein
MPAENIRLEKLVGDMLSPGVDDFRSRHSGGNLPDVLRFDGTTKNDVNRHEIVLHFEFRVSSYRQRPLLPADS